MYKREIERDAVGVMMYSEEFSIAANLRRATYEGRKIKKKKGTSKPKGTPAVQPQPTHLTAQAERNDGEQGGAVHEESRRGRLGA